MLAIGVYSTSVSAYLYGVFELDTVSYIHSSCVRVTSGIVMSISWNFQYFFAFGQSIFVSHALNRSKFTTTQTETDTNANEFETKNDRVKVIQGQINLVMIRFVSQPNSAPYML